MSVVVPGSAFQVSQVTGDVLSIVGSDVSLSQSDVPYQIVTNAPVAASSTDLLVYGDTVTITGDLVNPGRAIAIYARQIIVGATAFINVSGPDPVTTFAAGQPAEQTNTSDGAAGANGAPASSGLGAGTITLAAESIQTGGPDTGAGTPGRALCLAQLQTSSVLPSAIAAYQSAVGQTTLPLTLAGLADILTITDLTIGDVQHPTSVTVLPPDPQTSAYPVVLTFASLTMQGTVTLTAFGGATSGPLTGLCSATLTVPVLPSTTPGSAPPASVTVTNSSWTANTSSGLANDAIEAALDRQGAGAIQTPLAGALQPAMSALSTAAADAMAALQQGLILAAMGGPGGRGQDGHAGNPGTPGTHGQDSDDEVSPFSPPPSKCVGGQGGPGGQAGSAGTSGGGGAGGTITVNAVDPPAISMAAYANGGVGGPAGAAGAAGSGGTGGGGGTYYTGILSGPRQPAIAPSGATGALGGLASFAGAAGTTGPAGAAQENGGAFGQGGSFTYAQLAPSLALYQLVFAQQAAKLAYLDAQSSADYQTVITLYRWLQNVTQPFSASPPPSLGAVTPTDAATRAGIYQAATLELARLNAGLDYYGDPLNWVPVLTWNALDTFAGQLISLGENINTQYQDAVNASASQQASAADQARQTLQGNLAHIEDYETAVSQQMAALDKQISSLDGQINAAITNIQNEMTVLEQQYTEQQANCTFTDVLSALGSLVQLGMSGYSAVNDLTKALAVETAGANLIQGAGNLVLQATPSDASYQALSAAWSSLASTLSQYGSNSALIVVQDQQFDSLLQQYFGGLQATAVVEADVNGLINLIQTRNQVLLNYTSQFTQMQRLQAQYAQKTAELENVAALVATGQTPQLPDYLAFLQSSLTELGNAIVDDLYQMNQALQYWSVEPQTLEVTGLDIASLSEASSNLAQDVQAYLQGTTGRPYSAFQGMNYVLTASAQPDAFSRLASTGILVVRLGITDAEDPFTGYTNVTVETVSVSLPGVTPPAGTASDPTVLQLTLVQLGPDVLVAQDLTTMTFTHAPRPVPYEFNYTTGVDTVKGTVGDATQGFTGLSPFATWAIDFTSAANGWLALGQVTSVELTFSGQLLGSSSTSSS